MPSVIGMAFQDGEAAIELFQQDDARQFVGQGDLAERENRLCLGSDGIAPAIGRADGKQQLLRAVRLVILEEVGDLFRGELLAARVQQYQTRAGFGARSSPSASAAQLLTTARARRTQHSATAASGIPRSATE